MHVLFCPTCYLPQACRSPVAPLSPSCRLPVAFLSQKNTLPLSCRSPVALLSLSCRFLLSLPCRFPVAASPVALLSSSCRFPVAYPVAMSCFLSLPCRLPVATLSPPCRPPVALLSHLPCRLPVACLSLTVASLPLSCRWPVVFLSPPCRLPAATLSPSCRSLPHFTVACLAWPESIGDFNGTTHPTHTTTLRPNLWPWLAAKEKAGSLADVLLPQVDGIPYTTVRRFGGTKSYIDRAYATRLYQTSYEVSSARVIDFSSVHGTSDHDPILNCVHHPLDLFTLS